MRDDLTKAMNEFNKSSDTGQLLSTSSQDASTYGQERIRHLN